MANAARPGLKAATEPRAPLTEFVDEQQYRVIRSHPWNSDRAYQMKVMHASGEGEVCLDADNRDAFGVSLPSAVSFDHLLLAAKGISHCPSRSEARSGPEIARNLATVGLRLHLVSSPNWFSDTLPGFLVVNPGPVSLLHLDCDSYEATAEVLGMIVERLTPKTVIIMDDYHGFWGYWDGQFRSWAEFVGLAYRYAAFNRHAVVVCNVQSGATESPTEQTVPQ